MTPPLRAPLPLVRARPSGERARVAVPTASRTSLRASLGLALVGAIAGGCGGDARSRVAPIAARFEKDGKSGDTRTATFTYGDGLLTRLGVTKPDGDEDTFSNFLYAEGRLASVTQKGGRTATFGYDDSGRVQQVVTAPSGGTVIYTYGDGGLVRVDESSGAAETLTYEDGLLVRRTRTSPAGTREFAYTRGPSDRIDALRETLSGPNGTRLSLDVWAFTYDDGGRVSTVRRLDDERTYTLTYDDDGRLSTIRRTEEDAEKFELYTFTYGEPDRLGGGVSFHPSMPGGELVDLEGRPQAALSPTAFELEID